MSRRIPTLISLLAVVPLGFLFKAYAGPGRWWVNNWGSSVAYEVFWMLFVFLITPRRRWILQIGLAVCVITCILEFGQLWHPPLLERVRATFVGRALLGHAFTWWDLLAYPIGCTLGCLLLHRLAGER